MQYGHALLITLSFVIYASTALAHGGLETMKPAELEKIQRMLVQEGYLVIPKGTPYGVYTFESEEAFDKWDTERIKKSMKMQLEEMQAEQRERGAEAPTVLPLTTSEPTLLQKITNFFKKIFSWVL